MNSQVKNIVWIAMVIVVLGVAAFFVSGGFNSQNKIACTLDAKLCPDGSAVGRTGPNCEFAPCPETTSVQVFFGNSVLDPGALDCSVVFALPRAVPVATPAGQATLEALLKGPTEAEAAAGYFTSIPSGVQINSYEVEKGAAAVAKVDFSPELEQGVGGSCRVQAIRSQIEKTVRQFELVDEVEISIDGRTEDILQP